MHSIELLLNNSLNLNKPPRIIICKDGSPPHHFPRRHRARRLDRPPFADIRRECPNHSPISGRWARRGRHPRPAGLALRIRRRLVPIGICRGHLGESHFCFVPEDPDGVVLVRGRGGGGWMPASIPPTDSRSSSITFSLGESPLSHHDDDDSSIIAGQSR
jgi:hypothetical protein